QVGRFGESRSARFAFGAQLVPTFRGSGLRLRCFRARETINETLLVGRDPVRVPLERGGGLAVPELGRHVGDRRALRQQERGERVTQVVDAEAGQLCFLQRGGEVLPHAALVQRRARLRAEDPRRRFGQSALELLLAALGA